MKSALVRFGASAFVFAAALPACAGTKTISNNTPDDIKVWLTERNLDCGSNAGTVHAVIPPMSSKNVNYTGNSINGISIALYDASTASLQKETFSCTVTGGRMDNALNLNSTFEIGFALAYGITFSAQN